MNILTIQRCLCVTACLLLAGIAYSADAPPNADDVNADAGPANLRFNFRDVPLDTVLDYLSEAAGFSVVREATVEGRVDIVSMQPLNKDEAVNLLNSVLNDRGYTAIRNGRILTIVRSEDAKQKNIPVRSGASPEAIPATSEMVTQVIPVRHADVTQLLENLTPLLPSYAVASANESSNAIILTDTQADVRRMAEIINALDTSIASISEIHIFALAYANAGDAAALINALFQQPSAGPAAGQPPGAARKPGAAAKGKAAPGAKPDSVAKQAALRVVAVGDDRTNSVVVSAPEDTMPLIDTIVKELDTVGIPSAEMRVFPLKHSDAAEMTQIINDAFGQNAMVGTTGGPQPSRGPAKAPTGKAPGAAPKPGTSSSRQNVVLAHAVTDFRTNSVVVTAAAEIMEQVSEMIEKLESNPARTQKVFIYKLKNADAEDVANVLIGMLAQPGSNVNRPKPATTRQTGSIRRPGASTTNRRGSTSLINR